MTGWRIEQSLALELDITLAIMSGQTVMDMMDERATHIINSISTEWRSQWADMLGERRSSLAIMQILAYWADVLFETDYNKMSLAIRQLNFIDMLDKLEKEAALYGVYPDNALEKESRFIDLAIKHMTIAYTRFEFDKSLSESTKKLSKIELKQVFRLLHDSDLHIRFWHWVDRFYYETYQNWRTQYLDIMADLEAQAIAVLGAKEAIDTPPNIQWLPPHNPLHIAPELNQAVASGAIQVVFLAEPFGFTDLWVMYPDFVIVSFADGKEVFERFHTFSEDLANRMKAFSDPTRMVILRLIRHYSSTNTQIADYLGLARPTVSVHAKILREAGLIRSHQEGRSVRHEILPEAIQKTLNDVEKFLELSQKIDTNDEL